MNRTPMPAPGPELAEAVTLARVELDKVLDVTRGFIPTPVLDGLHAAYTLACEQAGVWPPSPWPEWPRAANVTPKPPTRSRVAPASPQRSTTQ